MCVEYNITPQIPSPFCATAPVPHLRTIGKKFTPSPDQLFQHSSLKILLTTYFQAFSVSTHHYNSLCCSNMTISFYFQDVGKYLADRGNDMSIFKCKKVVMVQWLHSVIPYVDLECEVLGDVSGVTWSVNGTLIDTCEYYTHLIFIILKLTLNTALILSENCSWVFFSGLLIQ